MILSREVLHSLLVPLSTPNHCMRMATGALQSGFNIARNRCTEARIDENHARNNF